MIIIFLYFFRLHVMLTAQQIRSFVQTQDIDMLTIPWMHAAKEIHTKRNICIRIGYMLQQQLAFLLFHFFLQNVTYKSKIFCAQPPTGVQSTH